MERYPVASDWETLSEFMKEENIASWAGWKNRTELIGWVSSTLQDLADPFVQEQRRMEQVKKLEKVRQQQAAQAAAYHEARLHDPSSSESYFARLHESHRKVKE
ncbi:hypothetical protein PR202_ga00301 [Eleusine coracana subsp. coracana]|uniref:Uncharacterized protein n=1 Tax=Eleusine coracana subsp. coracana TaxID=191504 RepID=A0AAV5BC01_ELECO|nr:hypothetical protein PR202_ga00301 [Eleusine coracana subsp. coracana]